MSSRLCVDFGPDQTAVLARLSGEMGTSKAAVLRYGLTLIAVALRESRRGKSLGIIDGDRIESRLVGVWDDMAPLG